MGVGMLFPWNMFITAQVYFQVRLRGSNFADNFGNFFSVAFMLSNVAWLVVLLKKIPLVFLAIFPRHNLTYPR
jgi:hypothetical protein